MEIALFFTILSVIIVSVFLLMTNDTTVKDRNEMMNDEDMWP